MIHKIWSNDKRFKRVEFSVGLNVILAERTLESGQKDTRNGAGKTTLLNVMHFCLGADLHRLSLPKDELEDWVFYISLDLCGETFTAKRSISNAKIIEIMGDVSKLALPPEVDSKGTTFYKNDDWKNLLGKCLFKIRGESSTKYVPSFRSLVSYFTRKGADAYTDPFKHFRNQKIYDLQIHNAYLLGLNWVLASEAQEIRDKESAIKALDSAIKVGIAATQGELEAERVRIERELKRESDALKKFNVHPQYKELQDQANQLTMTAHDLTNKNLVLRRKLERYEQTVAEEKAPDSESVERLFSEAGIHFAENIRRSLEEAKGFHKAIIRNRKFFLEVEISQLKNELSSNEEIMKTTCDTRAELLSLLEAHGALEEFSVLQERTVEKKGQLEGIKNKIADIRDVTLHKKNIKASRIELETKLQRDYEQNRSEWEKAVSLFSENSQALYDEPGNLIINTTDNGYKFEVEINKSSSEGVGKMKIFCYDLMLVELMRQRGGIDFLFHDSSIFDGVDSRQRALALMFAHEKALENNFQYICALNSDMIPSDDFKEGFEIANFVRLILKDQKPKDAALGFHFELVKNRG
ncbi:DUF2326 domain-containing protein [Pseudidiomarina sp.]|uniref:DUF2326 domain-containing protein n=1 Tax=Pseudidiomarina sp. TaxID=2081707 RepID=UPI003A97ED40